MNFIKKYQNKRCKTFFGKLIQLIIFNNLARLTFFLTLLLIGSIGFGKLNSTLLIWKILIGIGATYSIGFVLVALIFAWIINPIKKYLNKN